MKKYVVSLKSCGNPDYCQDPYHSISPEFIKHVDTLQEASEKCRKYISEYNLGGGNWNGGQVFENGVKIAEISYNGRIWNNEGLEIAA